MTNAASNANDINLSIDGRNLRVGPGTSVAAAIAMAGSIVTRRSVNGMARAPLCGMGVCQECRVTIDGRMHQLSCQTWCVDGMQILTAATATETETVMETER